MSRLVRTSTVTPATMLISSRYFANKADTAPDVNAFEELLASLQRINTYNPPVQTCSTGWKFHGLYNGPTSIAFLFYKLHLIYKDTDFKQQSLLEWALAYLDLSSYVPKPDPDPDHCGIANETLAYNTLMAVVSQDESLVSRLCSYHTSINTKSRSGSNEWLYGRAGYLYFLRLARSAFNADEHPSTMKLLTQTIKVTVERILAEPQPWTWHGSYYLGAAHGVIGIICQVVLADPSAASKLHRLLEGMLDQQYSSGNFSSSLPKGTDQLVQFCHGGPGFILSLESITPYFPALKQKLETAIAKARADVWARGLLVKEPSLCHGIAGNALTLETYDEMRVFLAHMTTTALEEREWMSQAGRSDKFVSLYTGEAGRAWTWAVLDQRLPKTCIGYNDL